jgi:hypothetical protein
VTLHSDSDIGSKGKGAFLLKGSSKKKRSRKEMEEVKIEEEHLERDKQDFLRQVKMMKVAQEQLQEELAKHRKNEEILTNLHSQGVIDNSGRATKGRPQ